MNRVRRTCRMLAIGLSPGFVLWLAGCASTAGLSPRAADETTADARQQAVVATFERTRSEAQWSAARDAAAAGNLALAQRNLQGLLQREPDHLEARLLLAELLLAAGQPAAAETHLQAAVAAHPESPQAHYAWGLWLDTQHQPREALHHLQRACELEPDNELYRLSLTAAFTGS